MTHRRNKVWRRKPRTRDPVFGDMILMGALLEVGLAAQTCTECTDEPNTYMVTNGLVCDEYPSAYTKFCKQNANWAKQKFCQRSCFENGAGYFGDVCFGSAAFSAAPTIASSTLASSAAIAAAAAAAAAIAALAS